MNLTMTENMDYALPTATQLAVRISNLFCKSAMALTRSVFFMPTILWWAVWRLFGAPTLAGITNSVQSATQLISNNRGGSQILQEDTTMPKSNVAHLRPANNQTPFSVPETDQVIPLEEIVVKLPEFLETALSYIISDFDYENNITSNTAVAVRILATMVDRLNTSLEQCHE